MTSSPPKKSRTPIIAGVVVVIIVAIGVYIYMMGGPITRSFTPREQEAVKMMSSDLQGLLLAETATNNRRGRYMVDPEEAGMIQSLGVDRPVVHVTDDSWWATVTAPAAPGVQCAIAVNARNPLSRRAKTGEIVCR